MKITRDAHRPVLFTPLHSRLIRRKVATWHRRVQQPGDRTTNSTQPDRIPFPAGTEGQYGLNLVTEPVMMICSTESLSLFALKQRRLMQAKLIPIAGGNDVWVTKDLMIVGRKRGMCDIIVDHGSVSKLHCAIAKTDGLLFIRDLGSTNGTKVNGQKVVRGALLPGDELAFAKVKYKVFLGPGEPPPAADERTEMLEVPNFTSSEQFNDDDASQLDDDDEPFPMLS